MFYCDIAESAGMYGGTLAFFQELWTVVYIYMRQGMSHDSSLVEIVPLINFI